MKKAARIVFKIENIIYIVCLAIVGIAAIVVSVLFPQILEAFKDPKNWNPQPASIDDDVALAMTLVCTCSVYISLVLLIVGVVVINIGRSKIETARNKKDIITIGVLNCIFGSRLGAIFLFTTKQTEWPDGANESEY